MRKFIRRFLILFFLIGGAIMEMIGRNDLPEYSHSSELPRINWAQIESVANDRRNTLIEDSSLLPGQTFSINIAACQGKLADLYEVDHAEQLADWAMYGTLVSTMQSEATIRHAIADQLPIRFRWLEDVVNYQFGIGRRIIFASGDVWLFHPTNDPNPRVTLARLADQVRMEVGKIPDRILIFSFDTDLNSSTIRVTLDSVNDGDDLFSPDYGYIERTVKDLDQLRRGIESIDDISHIQKLADKTIKLGGRRFIEQKLEPPTFQDVVTIHKSQQLNKGAGVSAVETLRYATLPIRVAFANLVTEYNMGLQYARDFPRGLNMSGLNPPDAERFDRLIIKLNRALNLESEVSPSSSSTLPSSTSPSTSGPASRSSTTQGATSPLTATTNPASQQADAQKNVSPAQVRAELRRQFNILEEQSPQVEQMISALTEAKIRQLIADSQFPSLTPGFSLEPRWNISQMRDDIRQLLKNPDPIITKATEIQALQPTSRPAGSIATMSRRQSAVVMQAFKTIEHYRLPERWAADLDRILQRSTALRNEVQSNEMLLEGFIHLRNTARSDPSVDSIRVLALLSFIESQNRYMVARYDAIPDRSRVGTNLFYTDLLAKLWASLNYIEPGYRDKLYGTASMPIASSRLEPLYYQEALSKPSTRIWFGPRTAGFALADDGRELNFGHRATRIFSASTDVNHFAEPAVATEPARRVANWWDRNYSQLEEFEPQFHLQNQYMKWSVATAFLTSCDLFATINSVSVSNQTRFDDWYFTVSRKLRFNQPLPFFSEQMNSVGAFSTITSESFPIADTVGIISGGISLANSFTLNQATHYPKAAGPATLPIDLHRGGINYERSNSGQLNMLENTAMQGVRFDLPTPLGNEPAVTTISAPASTLFRNGPCELKLSGRIVERFSKIANGLVISISADENLVGHFWHHRTADGVALCWSDGPIETNQHRAQSLARAIACEFDAKAMSELDQAQITDDVLTISRHGQWNLFHLPAEITGTSVAMPGYLMHPVDEFTPEAIINTAAIDGRVSREINGGQNMNLVRVQMEQATLAKALDGITLQKITPWAGHPTAAPKRVRRIFTDAMPDAADEPRPIAIRVKGMTASNIEGIVTQNAVYIKRSSAMSGAEFSHFVERHQITTAQIMSWIGGDADVVEIAPAAIGDGRSAGSSTEYSTGIQLARSGTKTEMLSHLAGHIQTQRAFDEAIMSLKSQLHIDAIDQMRAGMPPVALWRLSELKESVSKIDANTLLWQDILAGNIDRKSAGTVAFNASSALEILQKTTDQNVAELLSNAFSKMKMNAPRDFFNIRLGDFPGVLSATIGQVQLKSFVNKINCELSADGVGASRIMTAGERETFARSLAEVELVSDTFEAYLSRSLLKQFEFDHQPNRAMIRALNDPAVDWIEIEVPAWSTFRPGQIQLASATLYLRSAGHPFSTVSRHRQFIRIARENKAR